MKTTIHNIFTAATKLTETAALCGMLATTYLVLASASASAQSKTFFPLPSPMVSTVPANGDVNPYGLAFVPPGFPTDGVLQPGDTLVANFNNSKNLSGTGTTIIRVPVGGGPVSTFYQGKGLGLTGALGVTSRGVVFVGNLPSTDGTPATATRGSLLLIDRKGNLLGSMIDPNLVAGPWGLAINDQGITAQVFFSNVLSGTITRLDLTIAADGLSVGVRNALTIAKGFNHKTDPDAFVLGPSGLAYDAANDILYVANSMDNAIYAIKGAGTRGDSNVGQGTMIYQDLDHLHGPVNMVIAPNGNLIVSNSDGSNSDEKQPSELTEFTTTGKFVSQFSVDADNGGAFGIALMSIGGGAAVRFAAVDDVTSTVSLWTIPTGK